MKTQYLLASIVTLISTVPLSAQTLLFLGGQAGPTQGADPAVMTFLEERYGAPNVTYMQSSVAQPGDEDSFDVLILSSTFGSGTARGKFQDSTTPILNWEEALARNAGGEFSISQGRTKDTSQHSITIEVEHPITAGFPVGQDVEMTTGSAEFWWSTGQQAPGAVSLASDDSNARNGFLTIIEAGDELISGQPAPGRRVMLGITDATFNFFTDDAKTLFGQSVDWLLGLSNQANRIQVTDLSHDANNGMLTISWQSQAGKLYNLRSEADPAAAAEPLTWPIFNTNMDIAATPPENTRTFAMPAEALRLFVIEEFDAPPVIFLSDDLESGGPGWTTLINDASQNTEWVLGTPAGSTGPISGADGSTNAWATNLGDYGENSDISLRSPVIDLSGAASAVLTFDAYRDADGVLDAAVVRFRRSSDLVQLGAEVALDMTVFDADWKGISIDVVPEALGESIVIEWNFVSDAGEDGFSGLSLDNIEVTD